MRISLCNELFGEVKLDYVCSLAHSLGYDGVEIAPFTISPDVTKVSSERRRGLCATASANDVSIAGTHWILVTDGKLSLFTPLGDCNKETVDYLKEVVRFTHEIGGQNAVFGSPKQRSIASDDVYDKAWPSAVQALLEVGDCARDHEVFFCIEPLSREQTNFINTAAEATRLLDEVGHPNVKLVLDVRSMCDEKASLPAIIETGSRHLCHFHANDCNGYIPGSGSTDYPEIIRSLRNIGYHGYLSVEVFDFKPDPLYIARQSVENLKRFLREN